MDQVKVALAILKKHYFWFLCGLASLVGLWAWNSATAKISTEFDQYKGDVSRRVTEQQAVVQQPNHPNQLVIEGFEQLNDRLRQNVLDVWQKLYEKQREEVLSWPRELRPDFLEFIQSKKFGEAIPIEYRERYQNYVRERFGELSDIVDAREVELTAIGGEGDMGFVPRSVGPVESSTGAAPTDEAYLVEWARENQEELQSKLVWEEPPSSVKMWISQEDLWVYETLLGIIAATNQGSTGPHNAKVSMIHALEAGQIASPGSNTRGRVMLLKPLEAAEEGEAAPPIGRADEMPMVGDVEGRGMGTEIDQEALDRQMLAGRYLDSEGTPIILEEGSTQTPSSDEFKRVPVRMVLQMDPREIPRLLVECANAPLPVEVKQVRLNVDSTSSTGGEGMMGAPTRRTRSQVDTSSADNLRDLRQVAQAKVVVQGIIYIFNPPNLEKLGIEPTSPAAAIAAETPAAAEPAADATEAAAPIDDAAEAPVDDAGAAPVDAAGEAPVDEAAEVPVDEAAAPAVEEPAAAPAAGDDAAINE